MPDLGLQSFNKLYPMMIRKYQDLVVDQNASEKDKINSIIQKLNALGKLSNDVVRDWNTVYQWTMNDGLSQDVSNKVEEMKANGELNTVLQGVFLALAGDMTTLHTSAKNTLVASINEVDDLAKANQTAINTNTANIATNTANIATNTTNIASNTSALAQKTTDLQQRGINAVTNGIDNTGSQNVGTLINQLITNNPNGRIYFPDGTYNIDQTINITNFCSLDLSTNAIFKCVTAMDKMVYVNRNSGEGLKQFIRGGIFDGNGLANNVIYEDNTSQWMFYNSVVKNGLQVNIYPHSGYEIYMENIRIDNTLAYSVNPNVVGIHATCTDSVFRNIIVKNCTTGAIDDGSNSWYDLHPWGNDLNRIPNTIGFTANSEVHLIKFTADTCAFGVTFGGGYNVYFKDCTFMFNNTYLTQLPSLTPVFISNTSSGTAYLYQCRLSSYGNNITIANAMTRCFLYNCSFSTPFNTGTTGYVNIQQVSTNFYRITLNSFTIGANNYTRLQIPLTGLNYNDFFFLTVVNDSNQSTYYKSYATNGFINLLYFNTTASAVTYSNLLVNLAVVPNSNFPITTSTF